MSDSGTSETAEIPVVQFMDRDVMCVPIHTTIIKAVKLFRAKNVTGACVVDGANKLLGIVSEYDLLLQAATEPLTSAIKFRAKPKTLRPNQTLKEALVTLYKHKVRRLPVLDAAGKVVGVVTRLDVLERLVKHHVQTAGEAD
jgi:CBS domain-containing protein